MFHDVVIGDFGRRAAVRFVAQCELHEFELLSHLVDETSTMRDEHRRWSFELQCDLAYFKNLDEGFLPRGEIGPEILIGYGPGDHSEVLQRIVSLASDACERVKRRCPTRSLRVVVPCNSLYVHLPRVIGPAGTIGVITPQVAVLSEFALYDEPVAVMPLGTSDAISGYEDLASEWSDSSLSVVRPSEELTLRVAEYVQLEVAGDVTQSMTAAISTRALAELDTPRLDAYKHKAIVSACTDILIPGTRDSLDALARYVVDSAYAEYQDPPVLRQDGVCR